MTEVKEEKKMVRGFAGLIYAVLMPLNEKEKFKEKFAKTQVKILINASNLNYAALIIVDKGTIDVESIPNKPKENIKKKNAGWDAFLEMNAAVFLAFSMKRLSLPGMAKLILKREVRVKGLLKLLKLMQMMKILAE
jgi:hypothetical protein